jgi:hypothetical protein
MRQAQCLLLLLYKPPAGQVDRWSSGGAVECAKVHVRDVHVRRAKKKKRKKKPLPIR